MKKNIIILLVILGVVFFSKTKAETLIIPKEAIRLRVVANSYSKYDKQIKMKVSEQLQQDIYKLVKNTKKVEEAREKITNNLDNIDKSIKQVLINENYPLDYKINYGDNYFPAKEYKKIKYEAGYYESVLVTLGEGKGKNWWCVLFPPLCLIEAEESDDVEYKFFVKELLDKYLK